VLFDAFEPEAVMAGLHEHAVTVCFGVPTQYDLLRTAASWGRPLPALRWMLSGGAPCPRRLHDAVVEAGYAFREGYGLTECGPNCFTTSDAIARARPGSVGHLMPHLEARLVDDHGHPVPAGTVGDLELRGPQLFGGYFGSPERTAEALTADGWLRTGDLAVRDAEGIWRISGRRKEMYITGGENVFPGEVENALLLCAGVAQAVVVALPDAQWGEVGGAVVVRAHGHDGLSEQALLAEVRRMLAGYKVPRVVRFVEALPTLGTGKVDRSAATALLASHAVGERGSGAAPSH
jgi:fatty-acyl-CoA synthase